MWPVFSTFVSVLTEMQTEVPAVVVGCFGLVVWSLPFSLEHCGAWWHQMAELL